MKNNGRTPAHVADELGVSLSAFHEAFSYYYAHIVEIRVFERTDESAFVRFRETSLKPRGGIQ